MNGGIHLTIDLSTDETKYISRFIGKGWKLHLSYGLVKQIENIFGTNLPSTLLLRRKTPNELISYCLTKIKQSCYGFNINEEQLKHALAYQIGKKESGIIKVNEELTVELILKW